jgi:hypothetical protein
MIHYKNGADLAKAIGVSAETLGNTFKKYNEIATTKKCPFGKSFFQNAHFDMEDNFYVAVVCPVLHFTMVYIYICAIQLYTGWHLNKS